MFEAYDLKSNPIAAIFRAILFIAPLITLFSPASAQIAMQDVPINLTVDVHVDAKTVGNNIAIEGRLTGVLRNAETTFNSLIPLLNKQFACKGLLSGIGVEISDIALRPNIVLASSGPPQFFNDRVLVAVSASATPCLTASFLNSYFNVQALLMIKETRSSVRIVVDDVTIEPRQGLIGRGIEKLDPDLLRRFARTLRSDLNAKVARINRMIAAQQVRAMTSQAYKFLRPTFETPTLSTAGGDLTIEMRMAGSISAKDANAILRSGN